MENFTIFVFVFQKTLEGNVNEFSAYVGRSKFYTKYEVQVQAFNNIGPGPNSSIVTVYSAEDREYSQLDETSSWLSLSVCVGMCTGLYE